MNMSAFLFGDRCRFTPSRMASLLLLLAVASTALITAVARPMQHVGYVDDTSRDALASIPDPALLPRLLACDIARDDHARQAIQEHLIGPLDELQVPLPEQCPFHPARDLVGPFVSARRQYTAMGYVCCYCGKTMQTREHMDRHYIRRHASELSNYTSSLCAAHYCDILQCDDYDTEAVLSPDVPCFPSRMTALQTKCRQELALCRPESTNATLLAAFAAVSEAMCSRLTCDSVKERAGNTILRRLLWYSIYFALVVIACGLSYEFAKLVYRWATKPRARKPMFAQPATLTRVCLIAQ